MKRLPFFIGLLVTGSALGILRPGQQQDVIRGPEVLEGQEQLAAQPAPQIAGPETAEQRYMRTNREQMTALRRQVRQADDDSDVARLQELAAEARRSGSDAEAHSEYRGSAGFYHGFNRIARDAEARIQHIQHPRPIHRAPVFEDAPDLGSVRRRDRTPSPIPSPAPTVFAPESE